MTTPTTPHKFTTTLFRHPKVFGLALTTLQPGHGYVVLAGTLGCVVATWAAFAVGAARRRYGVKLPAMYLEASDKNANAFNCIQRAHQNVLEQLPQFLFTLATGSIFRPEVAAIAGLVRVLGFIVYIKGYQSGDPAKRTRGSFGYLGGLALLGLTIEGAVKLIRGY